VPVLQTAVRVGVVACVASACVIGAGRLDTAVAVFDFQADANDAATYALRTYPGIEWLDDGARVIEDSRLWMPEDASYRVVEGPRSVEDRAGSLRFFLLVLLQPREQTVRRSTPWAFCYGCTRATLERGYEVLSDSGDGFLFVRRRA
jgi:hypothetical protein